MFFTGWSVTYTILMALLTIVASIGAGAVLLAILICLACKKKNLTDAIYPILFVIMTTGGVFGCLHDTLSDMW